MVSYKIIKFAAALLTTCIGLTSAASATCSKLASSITIEQPLSPAYSADQLLYWSTACSILLPACILVPANASQVSTIVTTLLTNNEKFAVKAGGHNPNPTFSSVSGGPLISLKSLNEVKYDAQSGTVRVGPGNRWSDVAKALEPFNVTVVGGRIGHVGVGGYLVGGGLSYLSTQYGWAVDTVVEFEVVLANGTFVTASATKNVDLFNVLRGGGNNFGIVTSYIMKAFPMGGIWGGQMIFSGDQTPQVLAAVRNFTENYPSDKAAIIATNELFIANLVNVWIVFVFYDGPVLPPGTFDVFTNIKPLVNTLAATTYYSFLSSFDALVLMGTVYTITTEMSPLPNATSGAKVLGAYHDYFTDVVNSQSSVLGLSATMALQPLPRRLATKARANGGDLLDLDDSVDRILMEYDFSYQFPSSNTAVDPAVQKLFEGERKLVQGFVADGTLPDAYVPLFMNDANQKQDYFGRLRPEKAAYARTVRNAVDPGGFFRDRTGGFKL